MSDAPSWLTEDKEEKEEKTEPVKGPSKVSNNPVAESPKKGGITKIFNINSVAREAATAQVHQQNVANVSDDGFTPAWATGKDYTPPQPSVTKDVESGDTLKPSGPVPLDLDPALLKRMQFYHAILRVLYMGAAIIMGAAAGLSLVNQSDIGAAFFAIYVLFFCLLMCCFEVGLNVRNICSNITNIVPFDLSNYYL
jgi:hypothetical protein